MNHNVMYMPWSRKKKTSYAVFNPLYSENFYDGDYEVEYCGSVPLHQFQLDDNEPYIQQAIDDLVTKDTRKVILSMATEAFSIQDMENNSITCHKLNTIPCCGTSLNPELQEYFCYMHKESETYYAHVFRCKAVAHTESLMARSKDMFHEAYRAALALRHIGSDSGSDSEL